MSKGDTPQEFLDNVRAGNCFAWGGEMRFRELVADIYLLTLPTRAKSAPTSARATLHADGQDHPARGTSGVDPGHDLRNPAAITSLNYLKQIVVARGLSFRFAKLVEEIRPGFRDGRTAVTRRAAERRAVTASFHPFLKCLDKTRHG